MRNGLDAVTDRRYNRDLQEHKQPLFPAPKDAKEGLVALTVVVAGLEFDRARLASACADRELYATDAAEELVRTGVPFRDAHEQVAGEVRGGLFQPPATLRSRPAPGPSGVRTRWRRRGHASVLQLPPETATVEDGERHVGGVSASRLAADSAPPRRLLRAHATPRRTGLHPLGARTPRHLQRQGLPQPRRRRPASAEEWEGSTVGWLTFLAGTLLLLVGGIVVGVATLRAKVLPGWLPSSSPSPCRSC